jgi:hypothetical protein
LHELVDDAGPKAAASSCHDSDFAAEPSCCHDGKIGMVGYLSVKSLSQSWA